MCSLQTWDRITRLSHISEQRPLGQSKLGPSRLQGNYLFRLKDTRGAVALPCLGAHTANESFQVVRSGYIRNDQNGRSRCLSTRGKEWRCGLWFEQKCLHSIRIRCSNVKLAFNAWFALYVCHIRDEQMSELHLFYPNMQFYDV